MKKHLLLTLLMGIGFFLGAAPAEQLPNGQASVEATGVVYINKQSPGKWVDIPRHLDWAKRSYVLLCSESERLDSISWAKALAELPDAVVYVVQVGEEGSPLRSSLTEQRIPSLFVVERNPFGEKWPENLDKVTGGTNWGRFYTGTDLLPLLSSRSALKGEFGGDGVITGSSAIQNSFYSERVVAP